MTPASEFASLPPLDAFLLRLEKRARLLAHVQAGCGVAAGQALSAVARVFAGGGADGPMARWPVHYWTLLLAAPQLRRGDAPWVDVPLPGVARLPQDQRLAVLLCLVSGLDEGDAADVLGIPVQAYRERIRASLPEDALGSPDLDVWRAWQAAVQRELARPEAAGAPPPMAEAVTRRLWLGVVACAMAFAATFLLHPRGRDVVQQWHAPVKRVELRRADAPMARFDPDASALHPDRELLAAPREAWLARQLPMLAWLDHASADLRDADAIALPVLLAPVALPIAAAFDTDAALVARARAWDRLPPRLRAERRGAWAAWRALDPAERHRLRAVALRVRQLPDAGRDALQARFDALPPDVRRGWWLGPRLGRDWPRVAPLFAYLEPGERDPVLRLLRDARPVEIDALERLAQSTAPEARAALRRALLAQPAGRRPAWLQEQLAR